jgi:hypothetical protein
LREPLRRRKVWVLIAGPGLVMRNSLRAGIFSGMAMAMTVSPGAFGASPNAELVIHEWGTITTVHAADGTPQGSLNRIEESEVLPPFVHRYEPESTRFDPKKRLIKAPLIPGRPDVTMRLETPVIYFHPANKRQFETAFDVRVSFRGGVINEFYPSAAADVKLDTARISEKMATGTIARQWTGEVLNNYVVGSLEWKGVKLHDTVVAPLTNDPVWLAPREVQAASVFLPDAGEGERYLFYRGVAALPALLQTHLKSRQITVSAPANMVWLDAESVALPNTWHVDVRAEGSLAFREHGALTLRKAAAGAEAGRFKRFSDADYAAENRGKLRASLKTALIKEGLFADEAEAMLNTWKHSYFEKPGLRVFYIVPRLWTDHFLPLSFSVAARVNRVIVGRIDLVP